MKDLVINTARKVQNENNVKIRIHHISNSKLVQ